uniref:Uncharacterized protein TCIL3000_7_5240 n=1 Tax=Trypanosoma congolense (strain IL3000) TaxID=1068625 RepID=G0UQP9_TRYCI|nr:unnamed protein product [Trypanosoma congolense IL3000]
MEASPQSILISSITGALRQNSASHSLPMGKADAVKLPSLAEKSEGIAGDGNGMVGKAAGEQIAGNRPISQSKSACNNGNGHNMEIKHSTRGARNTAPCIADGKRRLQELLQEQQMMEEKDLEGRLRHEGYIKEAEKYLNELRQMRRGNGPSNGGMLAPRVTLTTGPRPPSGVRKANSPSGPCTGISDIKVVKFTLLE